MTHVRSSILLIIVLLGSVEGADRLRAAGASRELAQNYGTLCETPAGSCIVPSAPIGSPCQCGQSWGTVRG